MVVGRWVGRLFGQVMSPYHSDQMSQRSQVSRFTLQCFEDSDCQFGQSKGRTRSPIELFWTAKNYDDAVDDDEAQLDAKCL